MNDTIPHHISPDYLSSLQNTERLSGFMGTPTKIMYQISRHRSNEGYPHNLHAPDRDAFFKFNDALMETYPEFQSIYYGLEDGMFAGHGFTGYV